MLDQILDVLLIVSAVTVTLLLAGYAAIVLEEAARQRQAARLRELPPTWRAPR